MFIFLLAKFLVTSLSMKQQRFYFDAKEGKAAEYGVTLKGETADFTCPGGCHYSQREVSPFSRPLRT